MTASGIAQMLAGLPDDRPEGPDIRSRSARGVPAGGAAGGPGQPACRRDHDGYVIPTADLWAAAGGWLGRLLDGERSRRVVNFEPAAVLAVSVVSIRV